MTLTKFSILFIIITLPFHFISYYNVNRIQAKEEVRQQYETIINNAIDDGNLALKLYTSQEYEGDHLKKIPIDAHEVLNAFLASYYYGFNAIGQEAKDELNRYILGLVIVGYDGYYLYGMKEVEDITGNKITQPTLSEKRPYLYEDGSYAMKVTLDGYVEVLNKTTWQVEKGMFDQMIDPPTGIDLSNFDNLRRQTILERIEGDLIETVNAHKDWSNRQGVLYNFYLPVMDNDPWSRTLNDVSLLVFIQGQPIGGGAYIEMASLNQSSILLKESVIGYEDVVDGSLYYCDSSCSHSQTDPLVSFFSSKENAAKAGYWPCFYLNK